MELNGNFLTTGIGSLPYKDAKECVKLVCSKFDIPFWPQLPKKNFKENMYVQFAEGLPALIIDDRNKKIYIDTSKDLSEGLSRIYEVDLSGDYSILGISEDFAEGLYAFCEGIKDSGFDCIKGQVTGPFSFGLSILDEKGRSIIYNESLKDAIIKLLEIKLCYEIDRLKLLSKKIIIFIDEPYLTSFGSSFISIDKRDVISMLGSLVDKIHSKGAMSGIHCCGNTDWTLPIEAGVDIINFDAYLYVNSLFIYSSEFNKFLEKGGYLAWGIVPTSDKVDIETDESLFDRLSSHISEFESKGISRHLVITHSLITPSCGLGTLPVHMADLIIERLSGVARLANDRLC